MSGTQVHYEVFFRKGAQAPWRLELATEDRVQALGFAEEALKDKRALAVRVTKETLDSESMEFNSVTLMSKGTIEAEKPKPKRDPAADPLCTGPRDLYNSPSREKIQRLLDDWLRRNHATPFELLHRPDLCEKLEAAGMEVQHAIQKISVPEAQHSGVPVHEIIRSYQKLAEQAFERVIKAGRSKQFPEITPETMGAVAEKLAGDPERQFLFGGAIAQALAPYTGWRAKVDRLLDFAEATPEAPQPRALCQVILEQPLSEIVASRAGLADLVGAQNLDLGGVLAALIRIAAPREVEALTRMDKSLERLIPQLDGPAVRLAERMNAGDFKMLGTVLARRVLAELTGPRRLRPADAKGEIEILRAIAMALTASAGRLLSHDEVQAAFVERSKAIVASDFVEAYLGRDDTAGREAQLLIKLCENVAGGANKRQAARWLMGSVTALRFETEFRSGTDAPTTRLAQLASLQKAVFHADLPEKETREISEKIGDVGGIVEADVKICLQLVRAQAPVLQKLSALLTMASGDAAPLGPAAERAKAEVVRLMRAPEVREALTGSPEMFSRMRPLLQQAGLMAA